MQHADIEKLLQAAEILGEQRTLDTFPMAAISAAQLLVSGISHAYTEVDLTQRRTYGLMDPLDSVPTPDLIDVMDAFVFQHPLITTFSQTQTADAQMISDFLKLHDYHRLEIYGDFYRLLDTEDQLAIQMETPSNRVVGLVVNRDRASFSERERMLFTLLRPHLIQSYRNATALSLLDDMATASGQQAIWVTADCRVARATYGVQALFDSYFGRQRVPGAGLPDYLIDWLASQRRRDGVDVRATQPLQILGPDGSLTVRFVTAPAGGLDMLMLNEQRSMFPENAFATLGLSARQTDVVRWVVNGKTSAEIGELLGMKSRTVEKHLENIFVRLDVTSRAALVARALQSLDDLGDHRTSTKSAIVLYSARDVDEFRSGPTRTQANRLNGSS
ncbi:MAG TPA: helix-turn-helix transcriptional regulator [Nitrolancea sp.]|nr:helix-turn-helix transcriptional regulator [Nitrolancea sp.]